jgi:hypothetical protein
LKASDNTNQTTEDIAAFRKEVADEIASEETMLQKMNSSHRPDYQGHLLAVILIAITTVLVLLQSHVFLLWLIVGLLLYSYNFVIILIPTTTKRARPEEKGILLNMNMDDRWLAIKLLWKKKRMAVEIGLTVFLGGMVPLALSFSVIFGLGAFFALYLGFLSHMIEEQLAVIVLAQILFILLFYAMMIVLEPQAQGITRIATSYKGKMGEAQSNGRTAFMILMMFIVALLTFSMIIALGAIFLPGFTLLKIFRTSQVLEGVGFLILIFFLIAQLVIMRHFQGVMSRRMAAGLLRTRIEKLREEVLGPLDAWSEKKKELDKEESDKELRTIKKKYYSVVIYDIIKQDIFGYWPIYLVGPRLRYVLSDKALAYIR